MRIIKQQWKQNDTLTLAENSVTTSATAKLLCLSLKKIKKGKKEEGKEEGIKDLPSKLFNCLNFYMPF